MTRPTVCCTLLSVVDIANILLPNAGMKLSEWIEREKWSRSAFAAAIGVTPEAVRLYLQGDRMPRPRVLLRIEEVTAGAVRANDFVSEAAA